jgi:hydrogenase/urease accessory protein HupE
VILLGLVLVLPVPLPVLGAPVVAALIGLLVGATVANAQKRL